MKFLARALVAALAVAAMAAVPAQADPATTIECYGTVEITATSNMDVRTKGSNTHVSFDFTANHELCLEDGSHVMGTVTGHMKQRLGADGSLDLHFKETVYYGDGSLRFDGAASLDGGNWQSEVHSKGHGTGDLAGMKGSGNFWPTDNTGTHFADHISYRYH